MKGNEIRTLLKKKTTRFAAAFAAALVLGGGLYTYESRKDIPELVTYVDVEGSIEIPEEEVPLAAPKVTKTVSTKKSTKKIKLKKKSKKTYTQSGGTTTSRDTQTKKSGNVTTTIETVVETSTVNSFKKGSKVQKQTTTVTTTVTTTEVTNTPVATITASSNPVITLNTNTSAVSRSSAPVVTTASASAKSNGSLDIRSLAPQADARVLNAYTTLGFKVKQDSSVSYSGLFDARVQTITLKKIDTTVYHELGHFVAFIAGNVDMTSAFKAVYAAEKSKYTEFNKSYVTSTASEYFAESFKNYTLNPNALKAERPQTYAAIETAVNKITDAQVTKVGNIYASIWNKA